jgi:hypothetical protein
MSCAGNSIIIWEHKTGTILKEISEPLEVQKLFRLSNDCFACVLKSSQNGYLKIYDKNYICLKGIIMPEAFKNDSIEHITENLLAFSSDHEVFIYDLS